MKPRIRWYRHVEVWAVVHRPWPDAAPVTTLRHTWPEALAVLGIRCPEGWSR